MAESSPDFRYLNSGSVSPVSIGSGPSNFLLFILFAAFLASCIGHEREVPQSFLETPPPPELILINGKVVTVDSYISIKEEVAI